MKFVDWLESEVKALERADAMERGEIPPGPIEFTKAVDGSTFFEFVQLAKSNDDGSRETLIVNEGGMDLYRRHLKAMLDNTPADSTPRVVRQAAEEALAAAEAVGEQVAELSKRIEALDAERKNCIEVSPADLAQLFSEAIDESADEAGEVR